MRERLSGAVVVGALAGLVLAPAARAEDPKAVEGADLVPVPPAWLEGSRLVLAGAECSIGPPGPGWRWLCPPAPLPEGIFEIRCQGPEPSAHWFLHVEQERLGRLTREQVEDFVDKLDGAFARQRGLTVEKITCEPSDVPIAGRSFRFVDALRDSKGEATYSHGYVASERRIYVLGQLARTEAEPAELATSVRTFQLARRTKETPPPVTPTPGPRPSVGVILAVLSIPALVLLAGVVAFIVAWRRREHDP